MPSACTSKIRSMVSWDSSRTPSTPPPSATRTGSGRLTGVAVAVRGPDVARAASRACSRPASMSGPVKVLTIELAGPAPSRSTSSGGGGTTVGDPVPVRSRAPIWKSAPSGPAISSATNSSSVRPVDPPDHLADQVPLVERVVAGRRARLPPRRLRGQPRRGRRPSRTCPRTANGWSQPETPEVCDSRCRTSTLSLPFARELGPVRRDRRVRVELAAVDQHQRGEVGHRLRGRPDVDDRVLGPRRGRSRSRSPPQTSTTVWPSRSTPDRSAELLAGVEPSRRTRHGPRRSGHHSSRAHQPCEAPNHDRHRGARDVPRFTARDRASRMSRVPPAASRSPSVVIIGAGHVGDLPRRDAPAGRRPPTSRSSRRPATSAGPGVTTPIRG